MKVQAPSKTHFFTTLLTTLFTTLSASLLADEGAVFYRLQEGSTLVNDCLPCARPPILHPLEGTFFLTLEAIGDVTDRYRVDSIAFRTAGGEYTAGGSGTYLTVLTGGDGSKTEFLSLDLEINGEGPLRLESGKDSPANLPGLDVSVDEATSSLTRIYRIHLIAAPEGVPYELIPESVFVDECADCERPLVPIPVTGGFFLLKADENPLFTTYRLTDIRFENTVSAIEITGSGTYSLGGEVALVQEMDLEVSVSVDGSVRSPVVLSSGGKVGMLGHQFPEIEIQLREKDVVDPLHIYTVHLVARPIASSTPFRRGDSNDDGNVDVADPVHTIFWLFAGGSEPGCLDAADGDGNGASDVTDAVFVLSYLFLSGEAPPPPGPRLCGQGKALLGCRSYQSCGVPPGR